MNFLFDLQSIVLVITSIIGFYTFSTFSFNKFFLILPTLVFFYHFGIIPFAFIFCLLLFTYLNTKLIFKISDEYWQTRLYWLTFLLLILVFVVTEYFGQMQLIQAAGLGLIILLAAGWISDVYFGRIKQQFSIIDFLVYFLFFPKLIAGPLEKTSNFIFIL